MAENPDLGLGVEFYVKAVQNMRKSKEAGRPVHENREYCMIRFPADNKRELHAPAHELHYVGHLKRQMTYAERFPDVYRAFKETGEAVQGGTPIADLPALTEAQRADLRAQKVFTVEQLANLPDASRKRLGMGGMAMVEAAQAYLVAASGTAEVAALKRELEALRAQVNAKPTGPQADEGAYGELTDDDLRNALTDAGVSVDGRWKRKRLIEEIEKLARQKEEAA